MNPDEIAAAAERLRRDKAGEDVYDAYDELLDYPDGEGQGTRWEVDCAILADAYLPEHDPTPLTLDVLRQELGEPHYDGVKSPGSTENRKQWHVCDGKEMIWLESRRRWPVWRWQELHTLGQLRRILSVIREQEG